MLLAAILRGRNANFRRDVARALFPQTTPSTTTSRRRAAPAAIAGPPAGSRSLVAPTHKVERRLGALRARRATRPPIRGALDGVRQDRRFLRTAVPGSAQALLRLLFRDSDRMLRGAAREGIDSSRLGKVKEKAQRVYRSPSPVPTARGVMGRSFGSAAPRSSLPSPRWLVLKNLGARECAAGRADASIRRLPLVREARSRTARPQGALSTAGRELRPSWANTRMRTMSLANTLGKRTETRAPSRLGTM